MSSEDLNFFKYPLEVRREEHVVLRTFKKEGGSKLEDSGIQEGI